MIRPAREGPARLGRIAAAAALAACTLALAACGGDADEGVTPQGDPVAGEELVAEEQVEPSCGVCHTLAAAGFEGTTAPDLDRVQPGYQRVFEAVRDGPGAMPSYSDQLTEEEIHDVAAYVSEAVR